MTKDILPRADTSERSLISAAIIHPDECSKIFDLVGIEDFTGKNRAIVQAILSLRDDKVEVGGPSVMSKLAELGLSKNGIVGYLSSLIDADVASVDIEYDAKIVRQVAVRRELVIKENDLRNLLHNSADDKDVQDVLDSLQAINAKSINTKRVQSLSDPAPITTLIYRPPEKIPFLIEDRIPFGRGVLITGLGGSSKTRLLNQLAISVVIGRLLWSWEVERTGKAVLCLTEDTIDDVHRTLYNVVHAMELTDDEKDAVAENLIVYPLAGKDFKLLAKTATGTVEKTQIYRELADRVVGIGGVVLIGIDPALSVTDGDELDQGHQRALGKMVDDLSIHTGATCILVSHATKASLGAKELNSHNSRGGGAITDAVRAEFSLRNMTAEEAARAGINDQEERRRYVQFAATKGNQLPPSAYVPVWLRRDDSGVLFQADPSFDEGTPSDKDIEILKVLTDMSRFSTPTISEWRQRCIDAGLICGPTDNAKNQMMKRSCEKLKKAGLIKKGIGRGVWIGVG